MDGLRYCDNDECPNTHPQAELIMHCDELVVPGERDSLLCEFEDGTTVKASWDGEAQTATCCPPQVKHAGSQL